MNRTSSLLCPALALWACILAGCQAQSPASSAATAGAQGKAQLFEGMGSHHRDFHYASPQAQRYLDQGLTFAFAFNHDEAIRSFQEAARLDPNCAMAWWGVALCNGPHINNPAMDEAHSKAAWEALKKAEALQSHATPADRALIRALAARYSNPPPLDRAPLDKAYADAMRKAYGEYPGDTDIATLFSESLMDLRPWDLWDKDGTPRPETPEIVGVLEKTLAADPSHPGANHLYIHTVEASPHPEKALAAADRLRTLVPAAGHLVHMPAHIYARTGRWDQASDQNTKAAEADRRYRAISPNQGFYRIYMAHNDHFLAFGCMMEGRSKEGLRAARSLIAGIPPEFAKENAPFIDGFMATALEVLIRFGRWDDILAEPAPPDYFPLTTSAWHFARAVAYAAKGEVQKAETEQAAFREAAKKTPNDAPFGNNTAGAILAIAEHMLAGEIAFRKGDIDVAVTELTAGIVLEDALHYDEPPGWLQPLRHTLGAVLLSAGRTKDAERVYNDDLARWPENGWSLYGLARCQKESGSPEAAATEARFKKAWARADVTIGSTCMCVTRADAISPDVPGAELGTTALSSTPAPVP